MLQDGTPLEQRKGLGSYDLDQKVILVKCLSSRLVETIENVWHVQTIEANSYGLPVEFVHHSCIVYRLRNHTWSILEFLEQRKSLDEENFTSSISRIIQEEAFLFEQSDTCIFIKYVLFNAGHFVESIDFQEASGMRSESTEQSINTENNHYTLKFRYLSKEQEEDYGSEIPFNVNCCFESRLRQPSINEIGYPYDFIETFLKSKNIYIPGFRWFPEGIEEGERQVLSVEGFSSSDFEEFYYMSFIC